MGRRSIVKQDKDMLNTVNEPFFFIDIILQIVHQVVTVVFTQALDQPFSLSTVGQQRDA